jgi:transposase
LRHIVHISKNQPKRHYIERAKTTALTDEECNKLRKAFKTLAYLTDLVGEKNTTIAKLRKILFGAGTEKIRNILDDQGADNASASTAESGKTEETAKPKAKGHGRKGAEDFTGAERVQVEHESIKTGQRCPKCEKGKIHRVQEPATIVRITGQTPLKATVYELERWRCNLCGEVFTAKAPEEVGPGKWDEGAASMVGLLKYGTGMPFNRLEQLQKGLGVPLPASTQWDMVKEAADDLEPAWEELIRQGAQGEVLHNDDTGAVILEALRARRKRQQAWEEDDLPARTGTFTTGIVSVTGRAKDCSLFHRTSACGGKPPGHAAEAGRGAQSSYSDARWIVSQYSGCAGRT